MDLTRYADEYWAAKDDSVDRTRLRMFTQRVPEDALVLVVDGGPGMLAEMLDEKGCMVRMTDVSAHAVERARRKGLDAVQVDTDDHPLPFDDACFDFVISDSAIEHRFRPERALSECARVLRPGGDLLLLIPNVAHWRQRLWLLCGRWPVVKDGPTDVSHLRFLAAPQVRALLCATGLRPGCTLGFAGLWVKGLYPRFFRAPVVSGCYRLLTRIRPTLFARDILIVARKPA